MKITVYCYVEQVKISESEEASSLESVSESSGSCEDTASGIYISPMEYGWFATIDVP